MQRSMVARYGLSDGGVQTETKRNPRPIPVGNQSHVRILIKIIVGIASLKDPTFASAK